MNISGASGYVVRLGVRARDARDIVLDLTEVTLVDSEVVRFLVQCETQGVWLANHPAYIREWMVRESGLS